MHLSPREKGHDGWKAGSHNLKRRCENVAHLEGILTRNIPVFVLDKVVCPALCTITFERLLSITFILPVGRMLQC